MLKSDGTIEVIKNNNSLFVFAEEQWYGIVKIAAGKKHIVGMRCDGHVVATGDNQFGQCDVENWQAVSDIFVKDNYTIGIQCDDKYVICGNPDNVYAEDNDIANHVTDQRSVVPKNKTVIQGLGAVQEQKQQAESINPEIQVQRPNSHTGSKVIQGLGAVQEQRQQAESINPEIQVQRPNSTNNHVNNIWSFDDDAAETQLLSSVIAKMWITAGINHVIACDIHGNLQTAGDNRYGQRNISEWKNIVKVSATNHTVGLQSNGLVLAVGQNTNKQCAVGRWSNIRDITAGINYTVGVKMDGKIVIAGFNRHILEANSWKDIIAISAGNSHLVAIDKNHHVQICGNNSFNQQQAKYWYDILKISAGDYHTVGISQEGKVLACGDNITDTDSVKQEAGRILLMYVRVMDLPLV